MPTTSARTNASVVAVLAVAIGVGLWLAVGRGSSAHASLVGRQAPSFRTLAALRGNPVLLSFLDVREQAGSGAERSRAQAVFLRSMETQHRGLRVVVVDTGHSSRSELVNAFYDWGLPTTVADTDGLRRRYSVEQVPSTFLIAPDGRIVRSWRGFATAAQLDFAIRSL